jgi:hypothetical protein
VVALVLAAGGIAFLALSIVEHADARGELDDARRAVTVGEARSSDDARTLRDVQEQLATLHDQLTAVDAGAAAVADLDAQDLAAVQSAIDAGLRGDLAAYNAAVDQRAALDGEHDAKVEDLRQKVNALIAALDEFSRTAR